MKRMLFHFTSGNFLGVQVVHVSVIPVELAMA